LLRAQEQEARSACRRTRSPARSGNSVRKRMGARDFVRTREAGKMNHARRVASRWAGVLLESCKEFWAISFLSACEIEHGRFRALFANDFGLRYKMLSFAQKSVKAKHPPRRHRDTEEAEARKTNPWDKFPVSPQGCAPLKPTPIRDGLGCGGIPGEG
jgi:hypothetical protein